MVRLSVKALCLSAIALVSAKSPLLAWTNKNVADVTSTNFANVEDVATLLAPFLDTCPQSVLILDEPKFDIGELNEMRAVKNAFKAAKSALQIGHFDSEDVNNVDAIVNTIAEKCSNSIASEDKIGQENTIVIKKLAANISEAQRLIKNALSKVNDNTLVVYLSNNNVSSQKLLVQRQDATVTQATTGNTDANANQQANNAQGNNAQDNNQAANQQQPANNSTVVAKEETATFGKYVFFNTATFEGLVGMAPILIIALIGVSWLISIQSPTRFSNRKKDN